MVERGSLLVMIFLLFSSVGMGADYPNFIRNRFYFGEEQEQWIVVEEIYDDKFVLVWNDKNPIVLTRETPDGGWEVMKGRVGHKIVTSQWFYKDECLMLDWAEGLEDNQIKILNKGHLNCRTREIM